MELNSSNIDDISFLEQPWKSLWQGYFWCRLVLKSNLASKVFFLEHKDSALKTRDYICVEKRSIWFWQFWLFVIGQNSLFSDYEKDLISLCEKEKAVFIQVENIDYNWLLEDNSNKFKLGFYKKFITPYTATISLENLDADSVKDSFSQKWRYNLKKSIKAWLECYKVEKTDENIKKYFEIMKKTTTRKWFSTNNLSYFEEFLSSKNSHLYFVYEYWKVIAGGVFVDSWDVRIYYYWASDFSKNYPWYLLQYTSICDAILAWKKIYDFLWVANPLDKKSSLQNVTQFKKNFTKNIIKCSNSYIYVNKKIIYLILKTLKIIKKAFI